MAAHQTRTGMRTTNRFGRGTGEDDLLTREDVEQIPAWPFLDRKFVFDECLGEVLDAAADARSSSIRKYFMHKAAKRKMVLGKWYDNYATLTIHWAQIASGLDEEYRRAPECVRKQMENDYLGYERMNIKGILESVEGRVSKSRKDPIRERIREIQRAWCVVDAGPERVMKLVL